MNKTEVFNQALSNVPSPASYQEAWKIYNEVGEPFFLALFIPVICLLAMGAVIEDNYGKAMWENKGYWIMFFMVFLLSLAMVFLFPYFYMKF